MILGKNVRKKKVVTIGPDDLTRNMIQILDLVRKRGDNPDCVVGIATGGLLCADALRPVMDLPILSCAMRRKSTETKKKSHLTKILAYLPYRITDALRIYEDKALEKKRKKVFHPKIPEPSESLCQDVSTITQTVRAQGLKTVLVVDDAVDSGATMGCVIQCLKDHLPVGTKVISAVVTQTRPDPIYTPNVALHYLVLCRFPWSFDYRGR